VVCTIQDGEADIKFASWCKLLSQPMAVEAIDGDFLPIAMASCEGDVAVRRYKIGDGHNYEWVHIPTLRDGMASIIHGTKPEQILSTVKDRANWELECLLALIGITGTDYSRGIPLIKPKKLWLIMPKILPILANECFHSNNARPQLVPEVAAEAMYSVIYANVFASHVHNSSDFHAVMASLQSSKLSAKTKQSLPSFERAECTIRNINFILAYWTGLRPESMDAQYGFCEQGGQVKFQDEAKIL
jgi:hypothetical protein